MLKRVPKGKFWKLPDLPGLSEASDSLSVSDGGLHQTLWGKSTGLWPVKPKVLTFLFPKAIHLCPRVWGFIAFFSFSKSAHARFLMHDLVLRKWPTHNTTELINPILSIFFSFHTSTQCFKWPSSAWSDDFFFLLSEEIMVVGELGCCCSHSHQHCGPKTLPNIILSEGVEMLRNLN